jgi:hypothetical protein
MTEEKDGKEEGGPLLEQPAALEDHADLPSSTGVETNRRGSKQVPPPPTARSAAGNSGDSHGNSLTILLIVGTALLVVALIMSSIALGLAVGNRGCNFMPRGQMKRGGMNRSAAGRAFQELKNLESGGQVSIIRGNVVTVDGGNVTIQTSAGNETVVVTDGTRLRGAGLAGRQGGASSLKAGQQVTVLAKKTTDGKLEAVVVRAGLENRPGK